MFPSSVNDYIMKLRIQLQCGWYETLFFVYTSTFQADGETVITFYEALRTVIVSTPNDDKLIILGDFSVRVISNFVIWNVFGR